jgi:hypothetical protein
MNMKQKVFKKLVLSKETVADLGKQGLDAVKGGQVTKYCGTGVNCTYGCDGPAYTPYSNCC